MNKINKMDEMTEEKIMLDDELRRVARVLDSAANDISAMVSDGDLSPSWVDFAMAIRETAGPIRSKLAEL